MIVTPTAFLEANLVPISKAIDGFGGYNILCGVIAAGGEPHIYITGNVDGQFTLANELYEVLADKFREMSKRNPNGGSNIILGPGAV